MSFEPSDFGDSNTDGARKFSLEGKTLLVFNLLSHHDNRIAHIYRGALEVSFSKCSDFEALSAHGFREVIEKANFWIGREGGGISMGQYVENNLRSEYESYFLEKKPSFKDLDSNILSGFISSFLDFCTWIDNERGPKLAKAEKTLRKLQKSRPKPASFEDDINSWKELYDRFTDYAHHKSRASRFPLNKQIESLENILLKYLRPNEPAKFNEIKTIVELTFLPSRDTLEAIYLLFDQWAERVFFFECITDSKWVHILLENGWFDVGERYGPNPDSPNPLLPEVFFLEKFVVETPDPAQKAALKLATRATPFIQQRLLGIASQLPINLATDFISYAKAWLKERNPGRSHLSYQNFIAHLISSGLTKDVADLILAVLRLDFELEENSDSDTQSDLDQLVRISKTDSIWDLYDYKSLVSEITLKVQPDDVLNLLKIYCDLLSDAITHSGVNKGSEDRKWDDYSEIWMGSVEPSDQLRDYDHREYLVIGIRDLSERVISGRPARLNEAVEILKAFPWLIFKRLNLHLIREFGAIQQVNNELDAGAVLGADNPHEWFVMLEEKFDSLVEEDKNRILGWIEGGPDLSTRIEYYMQDHEGAPPDEETLDIWKRYWQYQQLSLLNGKLPEQWQERFNELHEHFKTPGHPAFRSWKSDVQIMPNESPFTVETILTEPNDWVLSEIRAWKQKQHLDEVDEWGLQGALKSAALKQPEFFLKDIQKYRILSDHERLSVDRYLSILQGCFEAAFAGTPLDWSSLLTETAWAIHGVILKLAGSENRNLGIEIARGLEGAISKKEVNFPSTAWDQLLGCIALLLQHPDPEKDGKDTESPGELAMTSLNTTRLVAMRALFDLDRVLHSEDGAQRDDLKKRVLELLEARLRAEPTLAGRGIYGEKMGMLLHFHREWVETHLDDLFPADRVAERNAVWSCFVTMQGATKTAFEALGKEYVRAIRSISQDPREKDSRQWDPGEGLVHHLAAYYWWGNLPLPDQPDASGNLLDRFYKNGTVALKAHLLTFIGRSMRTTKEGVPNDVQERFCNLMEWRLRELEQSGIKSDQLVELEGFWTWVDAQQLDAEWTVKILQRVLILRPFIGDGHDFMVIKPLAEYSANYPEVAMDCFHRIVFPDKNREKEIPYWWGMDEEIKMILRNGLASSEDAKKQAVEVQSVLINLARFEFQNLDPKPGDSGELG
ncbi:MAG: hypothetical protein K8R57_07505 [Verrucomicrobia bacterium]|nr:hypothetical protein [Verrucomicrobiota bacterium]